MGQMTTLNGFPGYLARPATPGPWPGLFVIQEWWGLDAQTKSIAERFAEAGYLAFSPDVYQGELAAPGDGETALKLVQKYGPGTPAALEELFDALKAHPDCTGKLGSVGFCFGGRMSLALATRRPLDAVCTFYGGGMQQIFEQIRHNLKSPTLGLFGDADVSIPVGAVEQFEQLLAEIGVEHQVIIYPNSGHAFFRDSDPAVYKPEASADAWKRVTAFFARHLQN